MRTTNFYKIVCESVDVFGKTILVDKNCKDLDEVNAVIKSDPSLLAQDKTWIIYPMSVTI